MNIHAFNLSINPHIYRDRFFGYATAVGLHIFLFFTGGALLVKPVDYGVELGQGGIEIHLVAASVEPVVEKFKAAPPIVQERIPEKVEIPPEPVQEIPKEDIVIPEALIKEPIVQKVEPVVEKPAVKETSVVKEKPKQSVNTQPSAVKGDGSSKMAGKNETTFHSAGGAITEAKPNYLKNPAPAYPWEAKKKGWEGMVVIKAVIDKSGHPIKVELEKSSGHNVLDETALKTVKKWSFYPATLGNIPVESAVVVPIRFELKEG